MTNSKLTIENYPLNSFGCGGHGLAGQMAALGYVSPATPVACTAEEIIVRRSR